METFEPVTPTGGRGRLLWVVIGGVAIVALIAAGILVIPRLLNTGAGAANVTAAAMPLDTQVFVAFNPHFDRLPNGDIVLKAWGDPEIATALEDNVRDALKDQDLDWDQDIASWLGDEVGVGIGNVRLEEFNSFDPPQPWIVLAMSTRDAAKSNAFLTKLRSASEAEGEAYAEATYRDVPTVEQVGVGRGESPSYAVVKDLVVVASGSQALHAAIDASLDKKGLDTSGKYQATLGKLRGGRVLTAYADLAPLIASFMELAEQAGELPPGGLGQEAFAALDTLQGAAVGVSFDADGVLLELVAVTDVDQLPVGGLSALAEPSSPNRLLRAVPDSTFVYLGGSLSPESIAAATENNPEFAEAAEMVERELGIDLQEDVFSWLNGELALVAMPGSLAGGASAIPFGFALLVDSEDAADAEASVHRLMQAIADQSFSEIEEVTVGDARLRAIVDFSGEPALVYGLLNDNLVVAYPENAAQKLANAASRPLADDETFKTAVAPLPANNSGYLYINPEQILDLVKLGLAFSGEECGACALFEPLRAVALASEQPPAEVGVGRTLMFMLLDVSK